MRRRHVYRGCMGNVTSLEQLARDFDGLFTRRVYRLETLDYYDAANERGPYAAFLAGERVDPEWRQGWKRIVRGVRASGRHMARVHVVSEPVSDYILFTLLHGYPANVEAGEDVRIAGRDDARAAGLPDMDYWLFDDDLAAILIYNDAGTVQYVEWRSRKEFPAFLTACCRWRAAALRLAAPLAAYVADHHISEERMTA